MSEDGEAPAVLLECEDCRRRYTPRQFGRTTVGDVPHDTMCPRCGAHLCEVVFDDDDDG